MTALERECHLYLLERYEALSSETKAMLHLNEMLQLTFAKVLWELQFYREKAHTFAKQ